MKKIAFILVVLIAGLLLTTACAKDNNDEIQALQSQIEQLQAELGTSAEISDTEEPLQYVENMQYTLKASFGDREGIYTGEVVDGIPEGQGIFTSVNPNGVTWTHTGEFKGGHFNGYGIAEWESGSKREGLFYMDLLAEGKMYANDGTLVYEGVFENGEPLSPIDEEIELSEYKNLIKKCSEDINNMAIILGNMGTYQANYWKAMNSIGGRVDFLKLGSSAYEWLEEEADITQEQVEEDYQNIVNQYKEIIDINVTEINKLDLRTKFSNLFDNLHNFYQLINSPSGTLSDFSKKVLDYLTETSNLYGAISILVE